MLLVLTMQGTVKLVFQPAEEGQGGAYYVLQEGVLDDASAIFGLHVDPALPVGVVSSRPGPFAATSGRFLATVTGKGGHAAMPHESIDPVVAAATTVVSLQKIISREIDPLQGAVCMCFCVVLAVLCCCSGLSDSASSSSLI